jgi:hypothetical protein
LIRCSQSTELAKWRGQRLDADDPAAVSRVSDLEGELTSICPDIDDKIDPEGCHQ